MTDDKNVRCDLRNSGRMESSDAACVDAESLGCKTNSPLTARLARFAADHPWPANRPQAVPRESEGWLSQPTSELLASVLGRQTRLVLEVGAWLGLSTRFILNQAPHATVISVDHWRGSAEHHMNPNLKELLPMLYETFLSSCWPYRSRIIPLRMSSLDGLDVLAREQLVPDVIYLDADHAYEAVKADILRVRAQFPQSILIGDDWDWDGVRRAACEAADELGGRIGVHGCAWRFCDAETCRQLGVEA